MHSVWSTVGALPNGKSKSPDATVRVGGAAAILTLVEEFGVDPLLVLREAGIDPELFKDPDNLITYQARGRLMSRAVSRSGCQHFGLLVGERMQLQSLGLVGLLARNAPDVGTALRTIVNFLHLHARGAVMKLSTDKQLAHLDLRCPPGRDSRRRPDRRWSCRDDAQCHADDLRT